MYNALIKGAVNHETTFVINGGKKQIFIFFFSPPHPESRFTLEGICWRGMETKKEQKACVDECPELRIGGGGGGLFKV